MLRNDLLQRNLPLTAELYDYLLAAGRMIPDPLLTELVERTREVTPQDAHMVVPTEQGALLTFLVRLLGAVNVVEVGTFTGYSSICLARGLPDGGSVTTFDISAAYAEVAREFWARAGIAERIELRLGPALETLPALPNHPHIDLAFIDGHKPEYVGYWEELVPRMRPGALLLVDNTLFNGEVVDALPGEKASGIRAFNEHARRDDRVELVMLPVADGLTMARRLPSDASLA